MAETEHDRQTLANRLAEYRRWCAETDRACSAVTPFALGAPMGGRPETTLREALRESIREREALRKRIAVHKGGMMRFVATDGTEKLVTLEEAGPDVIVRVDGYGIVALRAADGVVAVSAQTIGDAGLTPLQE